MLEGQQGVEISVGPQPKKDEMFGESKEISFNVIMSNLEFNSNVPREETFPNQLKDIDVTSTTHPNLARCKKAELMTIGTEAALPR